MIDNPTSNEVTPDLVRFWQKNPVEACKDILNVRLPPHQQIVLNSRWFSETEYDILSRGNGKTFINAVTAVLRAILNPGHRVGLIGPSFRQSKMIFAEIEKLYERSPYFQATCKKPPSKTPESCYITFKAAPGVNGSWIEALPIGTDGAKIRGARFYDVIVDEAAQVDPHVLDTVVRGFMATSADPMARVEYVQQQYERVKRGEIAESEIDTGENNKLILSSTAFYQYNHLWTRVQEAIKIITGGYKKCRRENNVEGIKKYTLKGIPLNGGQIPHRWMSNGELSLTAFTYLDPPRGFMSEKSIAQAKRDMSDYTFRMEYEAYFPPDSEGFFRREELNKCRAHRDFLCLDNPREGMRYAIGIDPARTSDNFAISIWEIDTDAGSLNLVRVMSYNSKAFTYMHREVRNVIKRFGVEYIEMDAGGGGTTIRDLLADKVNCPIGHSIILEQNFDEHRGMIGDRILGPLVQFSNYNWLQSTNNDLQSSIQHGRIRIAAEGGIILPPALEAMEDEMEAALVEMSSIVLTQRGDRQHWDTPNDTMRKDRYSAILVGFSAARKVLANHQKPKSLAMGGWAI
jgi:hypothetical protein